jgi:PAS domain S-box-containing protein
VSGPVEDLEAVAVSPPSYRNAHAGVLPRAQLPLAAALALLLSICAGAAFLAIQGQRQAADAAREETIDDAASVLRDQLLAAESGQRGFLVTGRAGLLAPFQAARAPIGAALDRLDAALASDPARAALARNLRGQVKQKLDELQRTIALNAIGQPEAAVALLNTRLGEQLDGGIETTLSTLQRSVGVARRAASERQARSTHLLLLAIAGAALGAIFMAGLAARELRRHFRLLLKRETQLDRLVESLEARVARRTRALEDVNQRFQIALDSAQVTVFSQHRDLTYSWISQAFREFTPERIVGLRDADIMPPENAAQLDSLKRRVIERGEPERAEIRLDFPPGTVWYDLHLVPTRAADGTVNGLVGGAAEISERKHYETHVRMLMREVTHRSKNLLAVVQALMRQTAARAETIADFSVTFGARLDSLAGAYDLLIKDDWRGTTMDQLVRSQLGRFAVAQETQIDISGPLVRVPPDATQNIGMALHELATNAARYGALSVRSGRVRIHWQVETDQDGAPACRIWWEESGGPEVRAPDKKGFGQIVIERTVARAVGGQVTLEYDPLGIRWMLVFPLKD